MHVLIVNPVSGGGVALPARDAILRFGKEQSIPMRAVMTDSSGHATMYAREAAAQGAQTVWMLGGDGSLSDAAQGLIDSPVPLGIIPCGTGNDLARALEIPKDPLKAFQHQLQKEKRPLDLWRINERFFINAAGTGFDAEALIHATRFKRLGNGKLSYLLSVFATMITHKDIRVRLTMNGKTRELPLLMLTFGNGRMIGGGICVAPEAIPDDGLLDAQLVHPVPRLRMPFELPKFLKAAQIGESYIEIELTTEALIESDIPLLFESDGELWEAQSAHIRRAEGTLLALW